MIDYTGKTIFVGLDVHKKTYSLTAICDGVVIKRIFCTHPTDFLEQRKIVAFLFKR